jgi:hypothetical protein
VASACGCAWPPGPGGPALRAERIAEAYPGVAGFRTRTVLHPAAPLSLTGATVDEAAVGDAVPTLHAFGRARTGASPATRAPT